MPKLFFMLLAAGRGVRIYLRSVLRSVTGLVSRLGQAPGSDGGAELEAEARMGAGMLNRAASEGRLDAQVGGSLTGRMVAWLVSVAYPVFHAGVAMLHTILSGAPGSGMGKDAQSQVDLTAGADTGTGMPGAFPGIREDGMEAGAVTAPPEPVKGKMKTFTELSSMGGSGGVVPAAAGMTTDIRVDTALGEGSPGAARAERAPVSLLTAHIMTWSAPEWVDDKTLYIRQVYETERDGDTLILH